MHVSDDDFVKLNISFDQLLIESDEDGLLPEDKAATQALILPVESDSSEDEDAESEDNEEESWSEDAVIHDRFVFAEECGPHADIESCENPIDYFELFVND